MTVPELIVFRRQDGVIHFQMFEFTLQPSNERTLERSNEIIWLRVDQSKWLKRSHSLDEIALRAAKKMVRLENWPVELHSNEKTVVEQVDTPTPIKISVVKEEAESEVEDKALMILTSFYSLESKEGPVTADKFLQRLQIQHPLLFKVKTRRSMRQWLSTHKAEIKETAKRDFIASVSGVPDIQSFAGELVTLSKRSQPITDIKLSLQKRIEPTTSNLVIYQTDAEPFPSPTAETLNYDDSLKVNSFFKSPSLRLLDDMLHQDGNSNSCLKVAGTSQLVPN